MDAALVLAANSVELARREPAERSIWIRIAIKSLILAEQSSGGLRVAKEEPRG